MFQIWSFYQKSHFWGGGRRNSWRKEEQSDGRRAVLRRRPHPGHRKGCACGGRGRRATTLQKRPRAGAPGRRCSGEERGNFSPSWDLCGGSGGPVLASRCPGLLRATSGLWAPPDLWSSEWATWIPRRVWKEPRSTGDRIRASFLFPSSSPPLEVCFGVCLMMHIKRGRQRAFTTINKHVLGRVRHEKFGDRGS